MYEAREHWIAYQKEKKAKMISNALKDVTGTDKQFRTKVFKNVVDDNRDLAN